MLFPERYDSEILTTAYRISNRIRDGESYRKIAVSLYLSGWYPNEVSKILYKAKLIALAKGA